MIVLLSYSPRLSIFLYAVYSLFFFKLHLSPSLLLFHISLIALVYILAIMSMLPCTYHNYVSFCSNFDPATVMSHRMYIGITSTVVLRLAISF